MESKTLKQVDIILALPGFNLIQQQPDFLRDCYEQIELYREPIVGWHIITTKDGKPMAWPITPGKYASVEDAQQAGYAIEYPSGECETPGERGFSNAEELLKHWQYQADVQVEILQEEEKQAAIRKEKQAAVATKS